MLPRSGLSTAIEPIPVDIRRFPWIRRLAADYAFAYHQVADFFAGNPADPSAWSAAIRRAQQFSRQRDTVASVLSAQQQRRNAPSEAIAASGRLRDPRAVAVVTGQQAGLFGGPLFTLLKALTAIRLAERVAAEHRVPVVPIFWIDSEDHDWDEVRSCVVLDAELNVLSIAMSNPDGANTRPVAWMRLDTSISHAIQALESALPATEFTASLLAELKDAYQPGFGMSDAFGRWLESVLGARGLVVYDASDPAAKPLLTDVFTHEIEYPGETTRLAHEAGAALQARGYHAQAMPAEGNVALFRLDGGRVPIRQQAGHFALGDRVESKAALLERVRDAPQEFSPNVLLRPLVQDTLFPCVCYIAGPNELAYLAQLRGVYDAFGVPMPLIQQRATVTILDSNSMRFLGRRNLPLEALRAQDEAALNDLLEAQLPPSIESSFEEASRVIEERMETLAKAVPEIDPTLEGAARSTLSRVQDDLKRLHNKIIQAAKRKDETLRRQFKHAQAQAFPAGHQQERTIGFIYFLNKYGPTLVDRLRDELPLDMGNHWVITI